MTLQELSQYFNLRKRLMRYEKILKSLRDTACPGTQVLTGMPHTSGVKDKVGDLAIEITDMEAQIHILSQEAYQEEIKVTAFINSIKDIEIRMIFRLRFLRCLTWGEVAALIGGRNTEVSVKNICYRYLESCDAVLRYDT